MWVPSFIGEIFQCGRNTIQYMKCLIQVVKYLNFLFSTTCTMILDIPSCVSEVGQNFSCSWGTLWEPLTLVAFKHAFCTLATERQYSFQSKSQKYTKQQPSFNSEPFQNQKKESIFLPLSFYLFHNLQTKALAFSLIKRISRRERTEKNLQALRTWSLMVSWSPLFLISSSLEGFLS